MLVCLVVPFLRTGPFYQSLTYQFAIGVAATFGIYVMLRMGLLSFTVPAFMAIGGYAAAMLAKKAGQTELLLLMAASFVVPALVAIPLGALVLRLKGLYFIFVTFIFNEILQLIFFETPTLTGGSDGIAGMPPATFLGADLGAPWKLVLVTVIVAVVAGLVTLWRHAALSRRVHVDRGERDACREPRRRRLEVSHDRLHRLGRRVGPRRLRAREHARHRASELVLVMVG